jgi:hypothetical protein
LARLRFYRDKQDSRGEIIALHLDANGGVATCSQRYDQYRPRKQQDGRGDRSGASVTAVTWFSSPSDIKRSNKTLKRTGSKAKRAALFLAKSADVVEADAVQIMGRLGRSGADRSAW